MSTHSQYGKFNRPVTAHLYDSIDEYVGKIENVDHKTMIIHYDRWYFMYFGPIKKDDGNDVRFVQVKMQQFERLSED